ncbi:MAG TPA: hypothetical protein VJ965_06180 [Anaerolineales bacterium]|nr:hypothetical protein [Anaerolineales bacterium]
MKRFSEWFYQISTLWLTIIVSGIFVLFMFTVLPDQAAKAEENAQGADSPDTSIYYSPDALFGMAEAYGEDGRAAYIYARFTFDLAFPLVYGAFLLVFVSWSLGKVIPEGSRWRLLNLVPVLGVLFDLLENTFTSLVMAGYPMRRELAAVLASVFTPIKWLFVYGSFGLLVIGLVGMVVVWLRGRAKK